MRWHRFNLDDKGGVDLEYVRWSQVMPGDIVQSRGTIAYKHHDFVGRDDDTKVFILHGAPILVLSRIPGVPGEEGPETGALTFVCLSRHGIIITITHLNIK